MIDLTRLLAIGCVAFAVSLTGCSTNGTSSENDSATSESDDDHSHSHDGEDHAHGDDDHDHDHDDHDHGGESHDLGSVTVGGATYEASFSGDLTPGAELHIDLKRTGGEEPLAVRVWVGEESGVGSMKVKGDAGDIEMHIHAEVPATVGDGTRLWIEVETMTGERSLASLGLK